MFQFFSTSPESKPRSLLPECQACGLLRQCNHGKQSPIRKGKTVIIVNGPGEDSPKGLAKQDKLDGVLRRFGLSSDEFTLIPAAACPVTGSEPKNTPWQHCQPLMIHEIKKLNPEKIIVYGKRALASVVQWLWGEPAGLPDNWYGRRIPSRELNAWIFPVGAKGIQANPKVAQIYLFKGLDIALKQEGRPYDQVPDYGKMVRISYDEAEIRRALAKASQSPLSAPDYETNCLKPEKHRSKVYTAAVAWLEGTKMDCLAFPMTEGVVDAWRSYLVSDSYKIAANLKFEERWSKVKFGVNVRRWTWDNVLSGHMYDPQPGVAGLKFQAFRDLGQRYFAGEVDKHFENSDEEGYNSIHLADKRALLTYNAYDSLAELDLGIMQMYTSGVRSDLWTDSLPLQKYYQFGEWV